MSARRKTAYIYILSAIVIWAAGASVIKFTLAGISPIDFLAYRFAVAGTISLLVLLVTRPKIMKPKRTVPLSAAHGILAYAVALTFLFVGLDSTTVLELTLIGTLGPILLMLGGAYFFHDRITKKEKTGASIAVAGTLFTVLYPAIAENAVKLSGNILILVFLIADTSQILIMKKYLRGGISPFVLANIGLVSAGVFYIVAYALLFDLGELVNTIMNLPIQYHLGVWYMAVPAGVIANYLHFRGTRSIEVSEAGLFAYLGAIAGVPFAILWLGEQVTPVFVIGAVVISIGVFIAESKRYRKKKSTRKK